MAHESTYESDANQALTVLEWQARYPATRYCYATLTKTRVLQCHEESSGDYWTQTYEWHWSYWAVLDWVYPNDGGWTNEQKKSLEDTLFRSIGNGGVISDFTNPVREQFATLGGKSGSTEVGITIPPHAVHNGNHYDFFQTYQMTESECHNISVFADEGIETYSWTASITNNRGDLWSFNSQRKLTLPQIHAEVLPNTDTPMPTEWRLNENNKLVMPVYRELINNLGAFSGASNLNMLIIPDSVEELGKKTCYETALSEITLPEDCTYYATSFPTDCVVTGGQIKESD